MKSIYVLTYNTADNTDRRIVHGVYSTKEKARAVYESLKEQYGDFLVDWEINERELDQ